METTQPGPLRVLILEDRASDAELMTRELRRGGIAESEPGKGATFIVELPCAGPPSREGVE